MTEKTDPRADPSVAILAVTAPLFPLGQVVATPGALELLAKHGVSPATLLQRHAAGDWGQLDASDRQANDEAVVHGLRVLSSYVLPVHVPGEAEVPTGDGDRVWVISEADRTSTTILQPSEY